MELSLLANSASSTVLNYAALTASDEFGSARLTASLESIFRIPDAAVLSASNAAAAVLPVLYGIFAGTVCKLASDKLAEYLLTNRNRTFFQTKTEQNLMLLLSALTGAAITLLVPFSAEMIYMFIILILCEAVALTDIHERIIPNELCLLIIVITLLFAIPGLLGAEGFPTFDLIRSLLGLVICFVLFCLPSAMSKKIGAGDVKLAASMGFCLGLGYSLLGIVLMGVFVLGYSFLQNKIPAVRMLKNMIPMGPFISASIVLILLACKVPALAAYTDAFLF